MQNSLNALSSASSLHFVTFVVFSSSHLPPLSLGRQATAGLPLAEGSLAYPLFLPLTSDRSHSHQGASPLFHCCCSDHLQCRFLGSLSRAKVTRLVVRPYYVATCGVSLDVPVWQYYVATFVTVEAVLPWALPWDQADCSLGQSTS